MTVPHQLGGMQGISSDGGDPTLPLAWCRLTGSLSRWGPSAAARRGGSTWDSRRPPVPPSPAPQPRRQRRQLLCAKFGPRFGLAAPAKAGRPRGDPFLPQELPAPRRAPAWQSVGGAVARAGHAPDLPLTVRMMRRCRGCRTVNRVKSAWLGDTVVMTHDLRIVNSRGSQWAGE
jgi:hypothetical protein